MLRSLTCVGGVTFGLFAGVVDLLVLARFLYLFRNGLSPLISAKLGCFLRERLDSWTGDGSAIKEYLSSDPIDSNDEEVRSFVSSDDWYPKEDTDNLSEELPEQLSLSRCSSGTAVLCSEMSSSWTWMGSPSCFVIAGMSLSASPSSAVCRERDFGHELLIFGDKNKIEFICNENKKSLVLFGSFMMFGVNNNNYSIMVRAVTWVHKENSMAYVALVLRYW